MKKKLLLIMAFLLVIPLAGCFKRDNLEDITIYTSAYPVEYITNRLYGKHSTIHSIYPDGVNIHKYKLTDKQIKDYSKSSLFIFNGLGKEKDYVIPMFNHNKKLKIIDTTMSMEFTSGIEELWLDPSNFLMLCQNIRNGLKEYITNHYLRNEIDENYEQLRIEVSNIDAKIRLMAESSNDKTIVVSSDIYKFFEKYKIKVISLEENDNLSEKTIADTIKLIKDGSINSIFLKQNEEITKTMQGIIDETGVEIITLNTLSTISSEDRNSKQDYITIMNNNIELIKNELYD